MAVSHCVPAGHTKHWLARVSFLTYSQQSRTRTTRKPSHDTGVWIRPAQHTGTEIQEPVPWSERSEYATPTRCDARGGSVYLRNRQEQVELHLALAEKAKIEIYEEEREYW